MTLSQLLVYCIFLPLGAITFIIGFTGCVGALRENTALLAAYAIFLAILLLLEMTAGILGFIFKDWIKDQATSGFQAFIVHYRDDPDQQNLIDWIQEGWVCFKIFLRMVLGNSLKSVYFEISTFILKNNLQLVLQDFFSTKGAS